MPDRQHNVGRPTGRLLRLWLRDFSRFFAHGFTLMGFRPAQAIMANTRPKLLIMHAPGGSNRRDGRYEFDRS